jgi:hypothetical protein
MLNFYFADMTGACCRLFVNNCSLLLVLIVRGLRCCSDEVILTSFKNQNKKFRDHIFQTIYFFFGNFDYIDNSEVLEALVFLEDVVELGRDLGSLARVLEEGPEFLQAVKLTVLVVLERLLLELGEQVRAEFLLEAVAVEAEQALQAVSIQI